MVWRWSPHHSLGRCKDLSLKLIVKRCFKGCVMFSFLHVHSELVYWYIIWKVNTRDRGSIWKTPFALCSLGVEISCKVCLIFVGVMMEMWGVSLAWGQVNSLVKRFAWGKLGVGRNYRWCLVIVAKFMGLERAKRLGLVVKFIIWRGGKTIKKGVEVIMEGREGRERSVVGSSRHCYFVMFFGWKRVLWYALHEIPSS